MVYTFGNGSNYAVSSENSPTSAITIARDLVNEDRAYNSAEAQKNRDWQEYMSNTAYSRAVADMKNAGLNPYLAYSQGGAPVGSGATATHSGLGATAMNNMFSNINTLMQNQTSRDVAVMNNATKLSTSFLNILSNSISRLTDVSALAKLLG